MRGAVREEYRLSLEVLKILQLFYFSRRFGRIGEFFRKTMFNP